MGLSSATETAEVQQWAKQYPEVAAEIEAIQSGLEAYAQTHAVAPAASVKDKVFAAINTKSKSAAPVIDLNTSENNTAKIYSISPAWKYAAAASIVLLIGSLIFNYTFYNKYQSASTELTSVQSDLQQQKDMANALQKDMGVITDKNALPVTLTGMPDVAADAAARIYWMKNTGEVYIDPSDLPKPKAGKQYQFWAIVDGVPVSGGMISAELDGKTVHIQKMKSFGQAQAFAISIEDAGPEKPVPGTVIAMGKM